MYTTKLTKATKSGGQDDDWPSFVFLVAFVVFPWT